MANPHDISVTVVDAGTTAPVIETLRLAAGATLADALRVSALALQLGDARRPGIFGQLCLPEQTLKEGDRIELYRPLLIDPKEARRRRAEVRGKKRR
jgi:putative ubiquitin-RnfH superfamily antitoxin RatB of RatAB toxin-antitoxin module